MADSKKDDKKDDKKAEKKVFDENDEAFCGYCSLMTLDQDGIACRTKGSTVKAPVQIVSAPGADPVQLEAHFLPTNPLFYLELRGEEQFYLWGQWWMDGPKHSESGQICTMVPMRMKDCLKEQDKTANAFKGHAHCEVIKAGAKRLLEVDFATEERKLKVKMARVTLAIPRAAWTEFKEHRVRLWKASKNLAGQEKEDDKKEEEGGKKDDQ